MEEFLLARAPDVDANTEEAALAVEAVRLDPSLRSVAELARQRGVTVRTLQRLFREYVGVTPKWVIQRYRLHEVVERLSSGGAIDWAQTALDLGYFDQSHLIRDFRRLTGSSPEHYRRP